MYRFFEKSKTRDINYNGVKRNMKNKTILIWIFTGLIIFNIVFSAFAHKVNIFAYIEGDRVYTESYFNDGKKCGAAKIEVWDNQQNKLLEGLTDEEGLFSFILPSLELITGGLKIVLIASMGHKAEYIIAEEELGKFRELKEKESINPVTSISSEDSSGDLKEITHWLENSLDEKLAPLTQEIRELKKYQQEKISFTEIIGGLGYILGIFGLIAYFLSFKK